MSDAVDAAREDSSGQEIEDPKWERKFGCFVFMFEHPK